MMKRGFGLFHLVISLTFLWLTISCQLVRNNVPAVTPPPAPVLTAIRALTYHSIRIEWSYGSEQIDGFHLERTTGTDTVFTRLITLPSTSHSYQDSLLQGATRYYYRIKAYRSTVESEPSVVMDTITPPSPPTAPANFAATALTGFRIVLTWSYSFTPVDSFQIERRTGAGNFVLLVTQNRDARGYLDTGLAVATAYYYRIRAFNISGSSPYSTIVSGNTQAIAPAAPTNLHTLRIVPGYVQIAWQAHSTDEIGFTIERRITGHDSFTIVGRRYQGDTSYYDATVGRVTSYDYRVYAYNNNGNSAYSNILTLTSSEILPVAPEIFDVTAPSPYSVLVYWRATTTNIDSFRLQRRVHGSLTYSTLAYPHRNDTTYLDTSCVPQVIYSYRICGLNRIGQSEYSNEDSVQTPNLRPNAPSNLTARALSTTRITLNWHRNSTDETGFLIERKTGFTGTFQTAGQTISHITSYDDNGLATSTLYGYRVTALGTLVNSDPSNTAYAYTSAPCQEIGHYTNNGIANAVITRESFAYISADTAGIQVVNLLQPGSPILVGAISLPGYTYEIALVNDTAYCANDFRGLQVVAMGNPAQPQYISYFGLPGLAHSVAVANHLAYLACGTGGLQIVRVYNPRSMSSIGEFRLTDASATAEQVLVSGNYAYVAYGWGGAYILDISLPNSPQTVGTMMVANAQAQGIAIDSTRAYVAYGYAGLHIFDISAPAHPREIGSVAANDFMAKVALTGHYAVVTDRANGILVINIEQPSTPVVVSTYITPSRAINVNVVGNTAYVCDLDTGLRIVQMTLP